ncbi:MAG: PEP-CTERM sorting domain-containing protein [Rubrivivax sp.]|nr:MAG: PEP-CTERM sorting domain-containing protein [Rubrivivax sp.]
MGVLMAPLLALSASGQIDSFGSSAASVVEGSTVDFFASFSVFTTSFSDGGSDLNEPLPVEGTQTWLLNWYRSEQETLREVQLSADGLSMTDMPSLSPGSSYSGNWSFSILYPTPGQFAVTLAGSWLSDVQVSVSSETATRDCMNIDPGGSNALQCSSWQFSYDDYTDTFSSGGAFAGQTINIDVTAAPVPEPSGIALWLGGFASLLGWRRRAHASTTRR